MHKLEAQVDFIAKDSPQSARRFKNELIRNLKSIAQNPYQFRKSVYFDNLNIRDFFF
jgi:plasmid stabilization system protein ParE